MKTITFLFSFIFVLTSNGGYAQSNDYYYYLGDQIPLSIDYQHLYIQATDSIDSQTLSTLGISSSTFFGDKEYWSGDNFSMYWSELTILDTISVVEYFQKINSLKELNGVVSVQPSVFTDSLQLNGVGTSSYFYVKLNSENDYNLLDSIAMVYNVNIIKPFGFMPLWYVLSVNQSTLYNVIQLSGLFYETGLFQATEPGFRVKFITTGCTPPNDQYFGQQWNLNNTINPNLDINGCSAWNYSTGNNVKVAVIDQGIIALTPDLVNNMAAQHYNTENYIGPPQFPNPVVTTNGIITYGAQDHGTMVAGVVGAEKNNNQVIAGVAPDCELISVSNAFNGAPGYVGTNQTILEMAAGIQWAWQNADADVINCSWETYQSYGTIQGIWHQTIYDAIYNALNYGRGGLGTVVVFSSGNWGDATLNFPANSQPDILTVGAMQKNGSRRTNSNYGQYLDVIAPGQEIYTTNGPGVTQIEATSAAAPHVAGIAALLIEEAPCLTNIQINNIIESSCQKVNNQSEYSSVSNRPFGTWSNYKGYGLVDAEASLIKAGQMYDPNSNLYIRDIESDLGYGGSYPYTWDIDESPDIWVRNDVNDGIANQVHQNPNSTNATFVYVRIFNRGCSPTVGNETVDLYWSQAASQFSWPQNWNGSNPSIGNHIGNLSVPILQPGESTILTFTWNVPDPGMYGNWNSCLLVRINELMMALPNTGDLGLDIYNSENIALRNTVVVSIPGIIEPPIFNELQMPHGGFMHVGNASDSTVMVDLNLFAPTYELDDPITEQAEVQLYFDDIGWSIIEPHVINRNDIKVLQNHGVQILAPNVIIDSLEFEPELRVPMYVGFNFLIDEQTAKNNFEYHVVQNFPGIDSILGTHWIGGVHYRINKDQRELFNADAGVDQSILKGEEVMIQADVVSEPVDYKWYGENDSLLHEGISFSITPANSKKIKLEVIATDGFKDYDSINVNVQKNFLSNISPNPTNDIINVQFSVDNFVNAKLKLVGSVQSSVNIDYTISANESFKNINMQSLPSGMYTLLLIVDDEIKDSKAVHKL